MQEANRRGRESLYNVYIIYIKARRGGRQGGRLADAGRGLSSPCVGETGRRPGRPPAGAERDAKGRGCRGAYIWRFWARRATRYWGRKNAAKKVEKI